jgi:hypothetical protein
LANLIFVHGQKGESMDDLISRQAAIEALHMRLMYRMGTDSNKKRLDEWINNLPSAQPEIVRCEYCKHRDPEDKKCDCGHDILWQLPRRNDWFCADGER